MATTKFTIIRATIYMMVLLTSGMFAFFQLISLIPGMYDYSSPGKFLNHVIFFLSLIVIFAISLFLIKKDKKVKIFLTNFINSVE